MKARYLLLFLLCIAFISLINAQPESAVRRAAKGKIVSEDELVSFKADMPYSKAIQSLGELSKKFEGKIIIDRSPMQNKDKQIGVDIESMYWKDAFELILRSNQLWYNDFPEYMEIISFEEASKRAEVGLPAAGTEPALVTKAVAIVDSGQYYSQVPEVEISAVFFDLNRSKLAEVGANFSIFRGSDLNLRASVYGANDIIETNVPQLEFNPSGNLVVDISTLISAMEKDELGEIVARPQLVVRSGQTSLFQVGEDFSVLEKDFSGNTVQRFYPTGIILSVRPKVWKIGEAQFVDVSYKIEKSSFTILTGGNSVIHKTQAIGSLLLLNGEEGYVGGLFSNDDKTVRKGIPFLKDLPWWFFGLRYLFGYDKKETQRRELIVLIKAEIIPTIEERAMQPQAAKNIIKENLKEMEKDFKKRTTK